MTNGLSVLACHLPDRPVIDLRLVLDAGAERETPSEAGVACLAIQSLSEGTELRSNEELFDALEMLGARFAVGVGWQGAVPTLSVPRTRLAAALDLVTEAVATPGFREHDIEKVRARQLDSFTAGAMVPGVAVGKAFSAAAFGAHTRYGRSLNGTPETVSTLDPAAVRQWWASYAHPSTATAVVVGDLRGVDLDAVLAKSLGQWVTDPVPVPEREPYVGTARGGCSIVDFPAGVQTTLCIGYALERIDVLDEPAFGAAVHVLGGYFSSRLVTKLREKKGLTYGVGCRIETRSDVSVFTVNTSVDERATSEAVGDILAEIRAVSRDITDEEIGKAVGNLVKAGPVNLRSLSRVASELTEDVLQRRPPGHYTRFRDHLRHVTAADAMEAFSRYVDSDTPVVAAAGPAERIAEDLERVVGVVPVVDDSGAGRAGVVPVTTT